MSSEFKFPEIDTSYWKTKDKAWMAEREAQWPAIEKIVSLNRKKPEVNVIKQYFLKGKMPNWEKYRDWDDLFRHLDLRFFLWLHPSDDPLVLKPLYRSYMESDLVHPRDVLSGYGAFLDNELLRATMPYKALEEYPFPFMGKKNIILFRILFEDLDYAKSSMNRLVRGKDEFEKNAQRLLFEYMGYHHFLNVRGWLMQDKTSTLNLNCLYQYDDVQKWSWTTITSDNTNKFLEEIKPKQGLQAYQKALHCINHFDTEKEGDTGRTRAVFQIRKILDEHDFVPEFRQMWEDVKSGKVEVKDPWKR